LWEENRRPLIFCAGKGTDADFLRNSHGARAEAYDRLQHFSEAARNWNETIKLSAPAEQVMLRASQASRVTTLVQEGKLENALDVVAELSKGGS
jgi:hypothetical protein